MYTKETAFGKTWREHAITSIENELIEAYDLAAEYGQIFDNVKHMDWFIEEYARRIKEGKITFLLPF